MKRLLLVAVLAVATSLFATAPALAVRTKGEDIYACYDPPPPPPPPRSPPPPPLATSAATSTAAATSASASPPPPSEDLEVGPSKQRVRRSRSSGRRGASVRQFKQTFTQANLYAVMRYEGSVPRLLQARTRIVSYSDVHGDMTWTRIPWEWRQKRHRLPAWGSGTTPRVFDYRGSAAFCVIPYACGPTKHPWVRIVFYDNNTLTKDMVSTRR